MASSRPASPHHEQRPHSPASQHQALSQDEKTDDKNALSDAQRAVSDAEKEDIAKAPQYVTGLKLWILMMPLCFTFFLVLLDISIIATAIPQITNDFHSLADVGWYGAAYQLASAAMQPLTGKLYVNFKNKWVFISFFALFELGSLLCGVATSSNMLIVGRAIQGMGTAGLQNGAFTIIAAASPLAKRPALIGMCQGIAQLGGVIGPLIGGALTQYTTYVYHPFPNIDL